MAVAVASRKLDKAQTVAVGVEPHRLGVDGDHSAERDGFGQVVLVEVDGGVRHELRVAHP
jgi:hypothetical protein